MRILVFGQTGQVARELARRVPPGVTLTMLDRAGADLGDPDACAAAIGARPCDAVINAAAFTAVDAAEAEHGTAQRINAEAPRIMALAAAAKGVPFLHVSTDYVFDGSGDAPWRPGDTPAPLNVYGATKLAGETGVRAAGGVHAILRTSWVFSAHGANFVKTMLRLGAERAALSIVDDQIGGPTPAADIADALFIIARALVADGGKTGTYHFAGTPATSWKCFARETFARAGLSVDITGIATADYPTPAKRPLNSRLDCSETGTVFGISPPDWKQGLDRVLREVTT